MKKMRKLIPAFAMLLVSAIMMSTASFAWFTMNETVTATGMNVQAKAAGNLLISTEKMMATDKDISVNLTKNDGKDELTPITYNETDKKWQTAGSTATVDPIFGTYEGALTDVAAGDMEYDNSRYFSDYKVYLATAGDAAEMMNQTLYVTLTGISGVDQDIAPAYTIAFYVDADGNNQIDYNTELAKTVNYEDFTNKNGHTPVASIDIKTGVNIPSTYGATADSKVGLLVVMRVYVDGDLNAAPKTKDVPKIEAAGANFVYDKATMQNYIFYSDAQGTVVVPSAGFDSQTDFTDLYYWNGRDMVPGPETTTKYVNNASVPNGSTIFNVTIGAKDGQ